MRIRSWGERKLELVERNPGKQVRGTRWCRFNNITASTRKVKIYWITVNKIEETKALYVEVTRLNVHWIVDRHWKNIGWRSLRKFYLSSRKASYDSGVRKINDLRNLSFDRQRLSFFFSFFFYSIHLSSFLSVWVYLSEIFSYTCVQLCLYISRYTTKSDRFIRTNPSAHGALRCQDDVRR